MKSVAVLGCSGSIGSSTLKVIRDNKDKFCVGILANYSDLESLRDSVKEFRPKFACCIQKKVIFVDGKEFGADTKDILSDQKLYSDIDLAINGIVGLAGLSPSLAVIRAGKILATANKESFVCGGTVINKAKERYNGVIRPMDSEHSAIWQCLDGEERSVNKIILTASGGAFRKLTVDEIRSKRALDALNHPNWQMGKKVTIDCATLMNKGMEIIEAKYLFDGKEVEVIQHDESIVHSMVEFNDGTVKACLSYPDMRLPIQYALTYPSRLHNTVPNLNFVKLGSLHFGEIDTFRFPCFEIAKEVAKKGDGAGTVMNAADEVCVKAYLENKIEFYDISDNIRLALDKYGSENVSCEEEIFGLDNRVREYVYGRIYGGYAN